MLRRWACTAIVEGVKDVEISATVQAETFQEASNAFDAVLAAVRRSDAWTTEKVYAYLS